MAQSNAERQRALRARDLAKGVIQVNIRVPREYDILLQVLAADLRKGHRLEGFVVRNLKTGRVKTVAA